MILDYTGERMVPEKADARTFWEHIYRYRFAVKYVAGRRVLDVACGEGYGAHALSQAGARQVIGVDISPEACQHAISKYGIDARCGDASELPLESNSVDTVVSFETIEHLPNPKSFIEECSRVLVPNGTLIISTPNRDVYSEQGQHNSFHCSEMDREGFAELLDSHFRKVRLFHQMVRMAPWWCLSSLAIEQSPWNDVKGFWRFKDVFKPHFLREGVNHIEADEVLRADPASTILRPDHFFSRLLNPLEIRKCSRFGDEESFYFVAVCTRPLVK